MKTNNNQLDGGLLVQLIMVLILVVLLILSIFWKFILPYAEIVAGLALLVMAYNNKRIYNRKVLTWIYAIFGVLLILTTGWSMING